MNASDTLRRLATALMPTSSEVGAAERHFDTICTRLQQTFGASRFITIGSHARGTAIRTFSDIDILAVLPRRVARWGGNLIAPRTFLAKVADDLQGRYRTTSVRPDGQAVVLNFSAGAHSVDVVPGIFEGMNGRRPMYLIPGTADEWITTSPETHDVIFGDANQRSGGKLGALARLAKGWKYGREAPISISSFYADMVLATTDVATGVKSYGQCLRDFFAQLVARHGRGLRDPGGVAGIISASPPQGQRDRLCVAARFALQHADSALHAESMRRDHEANRQWGIVFNRNF